LGRVADRNQVRQVGNLTLCELVAQARELRLVCVDHVLEDRLVLRRSILDVSLGLVQVLCDLGDLFLDRGTRLYSRSDRRSGAYRDRRGFSLGHVPPPRTNLLTRWRAMVSVPNTPSPGKAE